MKNEELYEVKVEDRKGLFDRVYQEVSFKYGGFRVKIQCVNWGKENMTIDLIDCLSSFTREGMKSLVDAIFDESDDVVSLRDQDHESDAEIQDREEKEVHFSGEEE